MWFILYFFFSSRRRHTRCALVTGVQTCALPIFSTILARQNGGKALREIARNPFIIATVLALLCKFLRIPMPTAIDTALSRLGACAIAIGLMCVGATLSLPGGRNAGMLMGWIITLRLMGMP